MSRRAVTWLVALPIVLVGSQLAHNAAYWWAYPEANLRATMLQQSGHGYLSYAPMLFAFAAAVELLALAVTAIDAARRLPARELPAGVLTVLPLITFVLQEHLERLASSGVFPWWTALDPTFWRGVVLQLPVGLAAWLVARLLLRSAIAVGRRLSTVPPRGRLRAPGEHRRRPTDAPALRIAPIARAAAGRAPPVEVV